MSQNPFAQPYEELRSYFYEKLGPSATASDYIHDFVHSDDPKFSGDTKKKRIKRALAAYYEKQRQESFDYEDREELKEYIINSLLHETESLTARRKSDDEKSLSMDGTETIDPKNVKNKIEINPVLRAQKPGQ